MRATSLCLGLFLSPLLLLAAALPDRFAWEQVLSRPETVRVGVHYEHWGVDYYGPYVDQRGQVWGLSVSRLGIHRYHLIPGHLCF